MKSSTLQFKSTMFYLIIYKYTKLVISIMCSSKKQQQCTIRYGGTFIPTTTMLSLYKDHLSYCNIVQTDYTNTLPILYSTPSYLLTHGLMASWSCIYTLKRRRWKNHTALLNIKWSQGIFSLYFERNYLFIAAAVFASFIL